MRQLQSASSLKSVFQQEDFSQKELVYNLYLNLREPGTFDYLVDKLRYLKDHKLEYFLPQLCYLCVKLHIPKLERFLVDKSSLKMKHYFIIHQLVDSYSDIERRDKSKSQHIKQLQSVLFYKYINIIQELETVLVNSAVDQRQLEHACNTMNDHDFISFQVLLYLEKENKSDYIVKCQNFIRSLIKISITLKQCPLEQRKDQLQKHIHNGNKLIRSMRASKPEIPFFHGILFPFPSQRYDTFESNMIVSIIENDYTCFNTKQRVPYRIIVETIDLKDLKLLDLEQAIIQQQFSSTTLEPDEFESQYDDLEKAMKEIAQSKILFDYDISALKNMVKRNSTNNQSPKRIPYKKSMTMECRNIDSIFHRVQHIKQVDHDYEEPDCFGPWEDIWEDKSAIIQKKSMYGHLQSYRLRQIIIKGGDDLSQMKRIFVREHLQLYLRPYEIVITSPNSGIIEFIPNTLSIDALKKKVPEFTTLSDFYKVTYKRDFDQALKNFLQSLAGYSLVQHFLQIKDRHNGNILIDNLGHIIHIDFGFMFTLSPGNINFESAPFKLTKEYIDLMQSLDSDMFMYFKSLLVQGFFALRKHLSELISLIMMMMEGSESDLLCFRGFNLGEFRARFKERATEVEIFQHIDELIDMSANNSRTSQYDWFQYMTNSISP